LSKTLIRILAQGRQLRHPVRKWRCAYRFNLLLRSRLRRSAKHWPYEAKDFLWGFQTGEGGNIAPPQKLALAFSTADVVILGWRLGRLADLLRENGLAAVHVLPKRYADLDRVRPFVASIIITPISRSPS
jgi:hypothetical protein